MTISETVTQSNPRLRAMLKRTVKQDFAGNVSRCARALGLTKANLYRIVRDERAGITPRTEQALTKWQLAAELDSLLMGALRVFLRKHEQIRPEAMLPVLFRLAALFAMATLGMEPEDVGHFSTLAGEQCRPEVAAFREFMRKRGVQCWRAARDR